MGKRKMAKKILAVILILMVIFPVYVLAASGRGQGEQENKDRAKAAFANAGVSHEPCAKADGSKFTVAYVDIDPYPASGEMLYYLVQELKNTGWITYEGDLPFDPADTDAKQLISWLANQDLGDYIRFTDDANYYIAVEDKESCMESLQAQIDAGTVDLIFCMGTSPGEMVIQEMQVTDVPVMVYFSVDPVAAGLSAADDYSGQDNVWCHTSSEVYQNQLQFYYENCPFENIGMVYYSESVAAMSAYRSAAEEIGCKIMEKKIETLSNAEDENEVAAYYEMLENVFTELAKESGIDAFMLNTDIIKDESCIQKMLEIFYRQNIPVFVQNGEYYVKDGALMVVTASNAQVQAPFAADAMAAILNGEKPGDVYQKFVPSPYVSVNLDTAERLGISIKEELLLSAEKLYTETGGQ